MQARELGIAGEHLSGAEMAASVVTNASIVADGRAGAMSGPIIPEPFAIPPMVTLFPPTTIVTHDSLGNGSVVMIACAACGP